MIGDDDERVEDSVANTVDVVAMITTTTMILDDILDNFLFCAREDDDVNAAADACRTMIDL